MDHWVLLPPSIFPQRLTLSQRALANIHSQLQGLEREAVPQFPSAQVGGPGASPATSHWGRSVEPAEGGGSMGVVRRVWVGRTERGKGVAL